MRNSDVVTAMIYLNEVNEFNGPLVVIPGSHKQGVIDVAANTVEDSKTNDWFADYHQSTLYMSTLTSDLKYTLKENILSDMIKKNGLLSAKGKVGSVLFFHGNLFHASSNNLSPWNRHTFLITYNSIDNKLSDVERPRPNFISNRNFDKIISIEELILDNTKSL